MNALSLSGSEVSARIARAVDEDRLHVPMLPQVVTELLALLAMPDPDPRLLSQLVHRDPMLAAFVLRTASSPMYRGSAQIVSLQQAIARIGLRALGEIVIANGVGNRVFRAPGHEKLMHALFRRSLVTGLFAKEIARVGRKNVENAFVCGLLCDVGSPLVLQTAVEEARALKLPSQALDVPALMNQHAIRVGLALAKRWSLPPQVSVAIAYGRDYARAEQHKYEAQLTCLALELSRCLDDEDAADPAKLRRHPVLAELNLYPDQLAQLLGAAEGVLQSAEMLAA